MITLSTKQLSGCLSDSPESDTRGQGTSRDRVCIVSLFGPSGHNQKIDLY